VYSFLQQSSLAINNRLLNGRRDGQHIGVRSGWRGASTWCGYRRRFVPIEAKLIVSDVSNLGNQRFLHIMIYTHKYMCII
jgi:hypothetical protein